MIWEDIQGKKYPGYGRCIYCGSTGGDRGLRDEHIIPYSLGGNAEIKEANCVDCQDAIQPIDTHLAREIFGQHRIHNNVQTRYPKNRPKTLPAKFAINEQEVSADLPIADHPYSLALPVWGDAGFITGAPMAQIALDVKMQIYHYVPQTLYGALGVPETEPFQVMVSGRFDLWLFMRAIAKIAYCHTVLRYGLDGFKPLALPDLILGAVFSAIIFRRQPAQITIAAASEGPKARGFLSGVGNQAT